MHLFEVIAYLLSIIILAIALLLSNSGSSGGLASLSSQDLEIFKKTKDRGLVKFLQIAMFSLIFVLILVAVLYRIFWANYVN